MKSIFTIIAILFSIIIFPNMANATNYEQGDFVKSARNIPLVVIRFNQRRIYFEKSLYRAVSRAAEIKANVTFNIVSYVPKSSKSNISRDKINTNKVVKSLISMGIPQQRISVITRNSANIKFQEIYIYAK